MVKMLQKLSEIKTLDPSAFKEKLNGNKIVLITLLNKNGLVCQITNFGARVASLWAPDSEGKLQDIVLSFPEIEGYLQSKNNYFGAIIGRYANRIKNGFFELDGIKYSLPTNSSGNHLHGGFNGFDQVVWKIEKVTASSLQLSHISEHLDQGYPGNIKVRVLYELTPRNELKIEYRATTDRPTIINLTHHSFFNLKGAGIGSIEDHVFQIQASNYTPIDKFLIPTGEILSVEGTPLDLKQPTVLNKKINSSFDQIKYGNGFDHNYVLDKEKKGVGFAAKVIEPASGRLMEVFTNEPGLQFYSGNFLDGLVGKNQKLYEARGAFCLEAQHYPNSPNNPEFPDTTLRPEDEYYSTCIYKFSTI